MSGRAQTAGTHTITWDSHSLLIDGRRTMIFSGEFHYWRLPSVSQWQDRLEKMKAAGLNAVSIYFDWQYHSPAPGVYDFSSVRDVDRLLTMTDRLGLYVIARVGPYMNAEVDAGGLPGWLLTKPLFPRSQTWDGSQPHASYSALYTQYSREWYDHILPILARHQATDGKSVLLLSIENEYPEPQGSQQYMTDLYGFARADGIRVPIFHNDFRFKGDWSKLVDLYAYDSYPYGFSCCHQWYELHFHGVDSWETTLRKQLGISTPMFLSELQGGSFDPWGGVGYDAVSHRLDADWLNALDQSAFAQGATLLNTYMFAGGTTWGYMSEPGVYTSYDYGAPIGEAGQLRPSYYAAHRLGLFLKTYGSELAGADASAAATATNPGVTVHVRTDGASGTSFVFLRHGDPGDPIQTRLQLSLNGVPTVVPQKPGAMITVAGHGAETLVLNDVVGGLHMNYTTSQVLTRDATPEGSYLVLYGDAGTQGETDFSLPAGDTHVDHNEGVSVSKLDGQLRLDYRYSSLPHMVRVETSQGTVRLLILTTNQAGHVWPVNGGLVVGPDLVTTASTRKITLQVSSSAPVSLFGAGSDAQVQIDGRPVASPDDFMGRQLLGSPHGPTSLALPPLTSWKFAPGSPETQRRFDDATWQVADHPTTTNPNVPQGPSLLADDYGFHYGFVWYRGHFVATGQETALTISARQSYDVYLNGTFLGRGNESLDDPPHPYAQPQSMAIPAGLLRAGGDNVLSVLTESLGHDEGWLAGPLAQSPQGILSAHLEGSSQPIVWRIQGNSGGESGTDPMGLMNSSGLYGERQGWFKPTFDDSSWSVVNMPDDWSARNLHIAVGWYRTRFALHPPDGVSAPIGLTIPHASDKAVIWLNGVLLGRDWEERGPQHTFYLPDGVLHTRGDNVLAIAVWNRGHAGGLTAAPTLADYVAFRRHSLSIDSSATQDGGYWHTLGNRIVDDRDRPVRIASVNWAGMQNQYFVPGGLDKVPLAVLIHRVRDLGFNTIRLPFSNQLVEQNPIVTRRLEANPVLKGLHALNVMDAIVRAAGAAGLRIILEDHRSDSGADPETNGLWYTARYPEASWVRDWQELASRYKGNPTVVGVDLRNEPHTGPPGPWSVRTYLTQGATWGPYQGRDDPRTDWRLAAERGGDAVLRVNPHLLIFVEGIQQYPDPSQPQGLDSYWWGGILTPASRYPVRLAVAHQLVYSPHEYGPAKYSQPFFRADTMTYPALVRVWAQHWDFLEHGPVADQTPIFLGEFGTCGTSPLCVDSPTPGSQGLWFRWLMRFLRSHPEVGWSFWALNGTDVHNADQPNYLLTSDWQRQRLHQLVDTLRDIETAPGPEASSPISVR